jgi:hypothetical protein
MQDVKLAMTINLCFDPNSTFNENRQLVPRAAFNTYEVKAKPINCLHREQNENYRDFPVAESGKNPKPTRE